MDLTSLIFENALILIPVIFILTEGFKKAGWVKGKYLLLVALGLSLLLTPWYLGGFVPENVVQAILVAGGAVLVDQGSREFMEKGDR